MTKKASIVIISILVVLVLFFGGFSFIPQFPVGDYEIYYSPVNLIQKGADIGDKYIAPYVVDIGDLEGDAINTATSNAVKILSSRLSAVYGYHNSDIKLNEDNSRITVTIPTTTSHDGTSEEAIVSAVMIAGKFEFLSDQTYSEDVVQIGNYGDDVKYYRSATTQTYVNGENTYYLVEVALTAEGLEFANTNFAHSTNAVSAYGAVDGVVRYGVQHQLSVSTLQIYTSTQEDAKLVASMFNHGMLDIGLSQASDADTVVNTTTSMWLAIISAVLVVALAIVLLVRYKTLGLAAVLSLLISIILIVMFMGLAYFTVFNIFAFVGMVLGMALFAYCNIFVLENVKKKLVQATVGGAIKQGYSASWKRVLIISAIALVVGIICWVIPTFVTASLGNALVYCAIMTLATSLGITRLLAVVVTPLVAKQSA